MLNYQHSVKLNDLLLYKESLESMIPLFFSQNRTNYARYGSVYLYSLVNLPYTHPGANEMIASKGISVNRSSVPNSRTQVDITIEQTYNRDAKGSSSGIVGFSTNQGAYQRWASTKNCRGEYVNAINEFVGMKDEDDDSHKDIRPSQVRHGERDVCAVQKAICDFNNPFSIPDKNVLYCLSSGAPASSEVEVDLLNTDTKGKAAMQKFVHERLDKKSVKFHDPLPKMDVKNLASMAITNTITSSDKKTKEITATRNVFGQLAVLALNHNICLEKALSYPLSPVPWSMATADGLPTKTNKAVFQDHISRTHTITSLPKGEKAFIIDGNATLHQQVTIPDTFGALAENVFNTLPIQKHTRIDFVTDSPRLRSIKDLTRKSRGIGKGKEFLIASPLTKVPPDWKDLLHHNSNKEQIIRLLLNEWKKDKYAPTLQ